VRQNQLFPQSAVVIGRRGEMIGVIGHQAWQDGRQQRIEDKADSNVHQNQLFPQSAVVIGRRGEMIGVIGHQAWQDGR
jgi:GTPase Era involved in 16S rRNA processing